MYTCYDLRRYNHIISCNRVPDDYSVLSWWDTETNSVENNWDMGKLKIIDLINIIIYEVHSTKKNSNETFLNTTNTQVLNNNNKLTN